MAKSKITRTPGRWEIGASFVVDVIGATPVQKGNMRAFMPKGWTRPVITDSGGKELRAWESEIRTVVANHLDARGIPCAQEQALSVEIVFYLGRAKGDFGKAGLVPKARTAPSTKPDIDKLTRSVLDACTGVAWDDDARIVRLVVEKRYATADRDVGIWLRVTSRPSTIAEYAKHQQNTLALVRE